MTTDTAENKISEWSLTLWSSLGIFLLLGSSLGWAREQYGPWNRDLQIFESNDGRVFRNEGTAVERGGVPNLARASDGTLYLVFQWFPLDWPEAFDRIAIIQSADDGVTWSDPEPITLEGMPGNLHRAFDPTLVILPGGGFRLYFASERVSPNQPRGNRAIFSARSDDALHFAFEPGQRFGFEGSETYDPAVVFFQNRWHLFCPVSEKEGSAHHAVSDDGLHFTPLEEAAVPGPYTWIGNAVVIEGELWFYGSGRGTWRARSSDGANWQLDSSLEHLAGGDPAVAVKQNGGLIAVITGPLRSDAVPGHFFEPQ